MPFPLFDNSPGFTIQTFLDSFFLDVLSFSALSSSFFIFLNYFKNLAYYGSVTPFFIWNVKGRVSQGLIPIIS